MSFPLHGVTQGALLEALAREAPGREALVFPSGGVRWTFADLDARSRALARGLLAAGVAPGGRVVVFAPNAPDWIALQFAVARIGAVLVTANAQLAPPEIAYVLRQSRACALFATDELLARCPERPALVASFDRLDEFLRAGGRVFDAAVDERCAATRPDEPANIQYTSGTTGFPKGVVLTHRNIVENAYAMARLLDAGPGDRLLVQVPLFHCFGCAICVLGAATHAIPLVLLPRFDPLAALSAIESERVTLVHGVPTMFRALLDRPEFGRFDLRSARAGIMAGAPCPEALMRRVVDELAPGMVVAYGLTEASPSCSSSSPDDPIEIRCGTAGRAIEGVEVTVIDPDTGEARPTGEVGEIVVRGPNVMRGYFDDPAATAAAFTADGRLRTGDLGTIDAAGLVRVVGRLKEMIKRGGECVFPAEVEDALRAHPAVADAAVFGVPHDYWGEEVAAAVIRRPGAAVDAEALLAFLDDRVAKFKRPARIVFVDAFPLTGSGKVKKFKLREL